MLWEKGGDVSDGVKVLSSERMTSDVGVMWRRCVSSGGVGLSRKKTSGVGSCEIW